MADEKHGMSVPTEPAQALKGWLDHFYPPVKGVKADNFGDAYVTWVSWIGPPSSYAQAEAFLKGWWWADNRGKCEGITVEVSEGHEVRHSVRAPITRLFPPPFREIVDWVASNGGREVEYEYTILDEEQAEHGAPCHFVWIGGPSEKAMLGFLAGFRAASTREKCADPVPLADRTIRNPVPSQVPPPDKPHASPPKPDPDLVYIVEQAESPDRRLVDVDLPRHFFEGWLKQRGAELIICTPQTTVCMSTFTWTGGPSEETATVFIEGYQAGEVDYLERGV